VSTSSSGGTPHPENPAASSSGIFSTGPRLSTPITGGASAGTPRTPEQLPTVVVIGNGMVGQRFCDLMTEGESPIARVVTFCEEPVPAYDRVHLSEYFSGKDAQALSLASLDWYAERKIELHLGERGARVDRDRRVVVSSTGREVRYDLSAGGGATRLRRRPGYLARAADFRV